MIEVRDLIGIPYKVHGRDKEGMDCYGLAIEVLRRVGIYLPDVFYEDINKDTCEKIKILNEGLPLYEVENPCENCIIIMNSKGYQSHIAVYLGEGKIIHSIRGLGVVYEDFSKYKSRIVGFFKVGEKGCLH